MSVTYVWNQLCECVGAPAAVIILALAVASRFYGLFLREGIVQRCPVAFLFEDSRLPTMLLNAIRFYPDNEPISLHKREGLPQLLEGYEDDLVLFRIAPPSLAAFRTLQGVTDLIEGNLARQPAFRSVIAIAVEALPDEVTSCNPVVVQLEKGIFFPNVLSELLKYMDASVMNNEARFHDVLDGFSGSKDPKTECLYAALRFAASFADDPKDTEIVFEGYLEEALQQSEDLLEADGLSLLFVEELYKYCDGNRGIICHLSAQLNEASEAKELIFCTGDSYFIPDEIFTDICSGILSLQSQINRALAVDGIQATETCAGKVKYTQGRYIRVRGEPRKFRFHKLKRDQVDRDSFETLFWVSNGRAG